MSKYTLPSLDVLIADYLKLRSATKVARRYHCRPWTVQQMLKDAGVLGSYRRMNEEDVIADYLAGMRLHDIATKHRHDYSRVRAVIHQAGVFEGKRRCGIHATPRYDLIARTPLPDANPTAVQWAYIAGCVDGEGTIHNAKTLCRRRFMILVSISQKDRAMLDWIAEVSGVGQVVVKDKARGMHVYMLRRQRHVYYFLKGVVGMLIVKKALAEAAIRYLEDRYGAALSEDLEVLQSPDAPTPGPVAQP